MITHALRLYTRKIDHILASWDTKEIIETSTYEWLLYHKQRQNIEILQLVMYNIVHIPFDMK
jgi:hypothetical protein